MLKKRLIQCSAGLTCPQLQIQIMPLNWGLAFTIAQNVGGFQLGPLSIMVWWWGGQWEAHYKNDFRRVDKSHR